MYITSAPAQTNKQLFILNRCEMAAIVIDEPFKENTIIKVGVKQIYGCFIYEHVHFLANDRVGVLNIPYANKYPIYKTMDTIEIEIYLDKQILDVYICDLKHAYVGNVINFVFKQIPVSNLFKYILVASNRGNIFTDLREIYVPNCCHRYTSYRKINPCAFEFILLPYQFNLKDCEITNENFRSRC